MITFDGIDMEEVAPVKIEDIRVSPIQLSPISRQRAIAPGAEFVRMNHGIRTVTINFAMLEDDPQEREDHLLALKQWAKSDKEYILTTPHYEDRYLMAVCTSWPEPSYRQWWESKLRFVFTCFNNPYWTKVDEIRLSTGNPFLADGDVPPLMRIEQHFTAAAQNQAYTIGGETMRFTTIPAGDLVIDLNRQTAAVDGQSIMNYFDPASTFIHPRLGYQSYSGNGYLFYRGRWI